MPAPVNRLHDLRAELERRNLDGFLIPRADEHQGEYVPPHAQRLLWLTGFGGSAGMACVLKERAAIFIDGRYTLQVRDQVDCEAFEPRHVSNEPLSDWLKEALPDGGRLGYDPWLHSENQRLALEKAVAAKNGQLVACDDNPLDAVWADQPPPPLAPIAPHDLDYAGKAAGEKLQALAADLESKNLDAAILTLPDSIAWLLNVRGGDVLCTPLPLSFASLSRTGAIDWFVAPEKVGDNVRAHLDEDVTLNEPASFKEALKGFAKKRVLVDPASAPSWVFEQLRSGGAEVIKGSDPCQLPKALKNETELAGARSAHERDGVALTRFLHWIDQEASGGGVSELEACDRLEAIRREDPLYREASFETIAGSGPNGAIVHYRVTPETDRHLGEGELFLCDSGGQYLDGTTDVTRTVPVGVPNEEMRRCFTLVLKGHIALALARFPKGTTGGQLDSLARYALWQEGLDYDHGTGHGVGSYLGVHEGPQRISKVQQAVALQPGMIISNEPGYYRTGAFGIRIENLVAVGADDNGGETTEREMLSFETLTLAPIDRRLIDVDRLTEAERAWMDAYHARVRSSHLPHLSGDVRDWLVAMTEPLD